MRLALAQINPTVGDLAGNEALIQRDLAAAREAGAQLVVFPELALTGYPPEDLLLREDFLAATQAALLRVAAEARGIVALVGVPERAEDVYNAAAILADGAILGFYRKVYLPNYGVFDEQRYFQSGTRGGLIDAGGLRIGVTICEDIWEPGPPLTDEALAGATLVLNLSASPYHAGKGALREEMFRQRARDSLVPLAYCNLVGGQDELVFDGHSLVIDHEGTIVARAAQFAEELLVCEVDPGAAAAARLRDPGHRPQARRTPADVAVVADIGDLPAAAGPAPEPRLAPLLEPDPEVYAALGLGLHDYVAKNGFRHVVLGLSGGIDSALVACVAADALGPGRVTAVVMPSPYSSPETQGDARTLAARLGIQCLDVPIGETMTAYREALQAAVAGQDTGLMEENLQARIRGNLLMALSNAYGWLVITTGNKSEMSVGYSTLYGDSAGGFAVIKDCPKTLVYRLARLRNAASEDGAGPIPPSILERAPSAELRPGQKDEDSLPPYEILDAILEGYVEDDLGRAALVAKGLPAEAVERSIGLVDRAEYKRRQQPPGIKITPKAFGRDRRMPITNRYRG